LLLLKLIYSFVTLIYQFAYHNRHNMDEYNGCANNSLLNRNPVIKVLHPVLTDKYN